MKRSIATAILVAVLAISCLSRNPTIEAYREHFYSINFMDVENLSVKLTTEKIDISRNEKRMLNDGDILVYLTDEDRLGKMVILELDKNESGMLLFDFVTYDKGSLLSFQKSND